MDSRVAEVALFVEWVGLWLRKEVLLHDPVDLPLEVLALRGRCLARPRAGLLRIVRQGKEPQVARTRLIRPTITITILLRPAHRPQCS